MNREGDEPVRHRGKSKRKFSQSEDDIILEMVKEHGLGCWKEISEKLGTRTARQCRERWKHYLSPGIDASPWTSEEDLILARKVRELGPKWSLIRECLPGRTDVNIKNRYALILRRMMRKRVPSQPIGNPVVPVLPTPIPRESSGNKARNSKDLPDTDLLDFLDGALQLDDLEIFGIDGSVFGDGGLNSDLRNVNTKR